MMVTRGLGRGAYRGALVSFGLTRAQVIALTWLALCLGVLPVMEVDIDAVRGC
jgi:hypothetical protein